MQNNNDGHEQSQEKKSYIRGEAFMKHRELCDSLNKSVQKHKETLRQLYGVHVDRRGN